MVGFNLGEFREEQRDEDIVDMLCGTHSWPCFNMRVRYVSTPRWRSISRALCSPLMGRPL
jgi:hypothetical protein